jgi:hypothetical protein
MYCPQHTFTWRFPTISQPFTNAFNREVLWDCDASLYTITICLIRAKREKSNAGDREIKHWRQRNQTVQGEKSNGRDRETKYKT